MFEQLNLEIAKVEEENVQENQPPGVQSKCVKIAVLDTGCDLDGSLFNGEPSYEARVKHNWTDWAGSSSDPVDESKSKHGTAVSSLLLRLAPTAEIYVMRIARFEEDIESSGEAIGKVSYKLMASIRDVLIIFCFFQAIEYAAKECDVDIISLSFGFPHCEKVIESAIHEAEQHKRYSIVFFAAAANEGIHTEEMFPAYLDNVISVHGTEVSGAFVPDFNPPHRPFNKGRPTFGTLGRDVPWNWPEEQTMGGCSIATPIAAAIAAATIRCGIILHGDKGHKLISSRIGISHVFQEMSVERPHGYYSVVPWKLGDPLRRKSLLDGAIAGHPSRQDFD